MRNRKRALPNLVLVLLVVLAAASARTSAAQTTSENAAQAEALFRDGRVLVKAGRISEACIKFAESHRLDPQTGTLLNLALCHEDEGKTASAWAEFNEVAERSDRTSERSEFAQRHARAVEGKLSRLRILVEPADSGFILTLDGRPLRAAALGSLIPLDPGDHTIEATAPGMERWSEHVKIDPGPATRELTVNLVVAPVAPPPETPAPAPPSPSPVAPRPAPDPAPTSTARRNVGFAIGALGIVGIGVGTGFGISALSQKDEYDSRWSGGLCRSPDNCAAATEAKRSLDRTTLVSTIGFGVGAVGLITGLYLVLSTPSAKPPPAAVRVSPVLGETHGLAIAGEF